MDSLIASIPPLDISTPIEIPTAPAMLEVPPVVEPPLLRLAPQLPALPLHSSHYWIYLNDMIMGVLFLQKPEWLAFKSASMAAIHTSLFRSMEATFTKP